MKRWFRNLLKGISLTGALFVFQACYGSPQMPYCPEAEEETEVPADVASASVEEVPSMDDAV